VVLPVENPYSILLDSVPWQIFLTGTLKTEITSERLVRLCWWNFLEAFCTRFKGDVRKYRHFCDYFVRIERGELGDRWHCHALIRLPNRRATKRLAFAIKAIWQAIPAAGISRTRLITSVQPDGSSTTLADYLCKLEENKYEGSKFPGADSFILSPSLLHGVCHDQEHLR